MEDVGSDEAGGAIGENPLAVCGWHGRRVENEEREVKEVEEEKEVKEKRKREI